MNYALDTDLLAQIMAIQIQEIQDLVLEYSTIRHPDREEEPLDVYVTEFIFNPNEWNNAEEALNNTAHSTANLLTTQTNTGFVLHTNIPFRDPNNPHDYKGSFLGFHHNGALPGDRNPLILDYPGGRSHIDLIVEDLVNT